MIEKLTNKIINKLNDEFKKDETKQKINELLKPITLKIYYILIPYLGLGILLYLILLILIIYIIFSIKKISNNYI